MNWEEILSGRAGLPGLRSALSGPLSRRLLRREVQKMLQPGYSPGSFRLTRAKFKPGRKLLAYFKFPALAGDGRLSDPLHLAVAWQDEQDRPPSSDGWGELQEQASRSGLMPVQCDLWKELPEQGLTLQIWPFDPQFPKLVPLSNPSYVAEMLDSLGIPRSRSQAPAITPIRYRPGERHVLRYLTSPMGPAAVDDGRLYAKLYSNEEDAARAFGVADRVAAWLAGNRLGLQGNQPRAFSRTDHVILYPHASGVPLSRQFHRSRRWLSTQLGLIGRALYALHSGPETLQVELKQNTFANEAKVVRRASEHLQVLLPQAYDQILQILDQALERYSALPQEQPTFTHSDFKSDHILTTPQGLTLIDFDTCKLADPALDLGKFLADLDWWFAQKGLPGVNEAQAELLKGYAGPGTPDALVRERLERAKLFHVLILTKIVVRRVPLYRQEWTETTARMIEQAAQFLRAPVVA